MKPSIIQRLPIIAIAAFTLFAGAAQATHWPQPGGDSARSGHQPADQAALPMKFRWQGAGVATSPIVTAGATLADQRVVYGRYASDGPGGSDLNGRVRVLRYSNGDVMADVDIDDESTREPPATGTSDNDLFGPTPYQDVGPMEASPHTGGPTQIYVVHNDDNQPAVRYNAMTQSEQTLPNPNSSDIALAQIRVSDGRRMSDVPIYDTADPIFGVNTAGYTIEAAPAIGPDESGSRRILFTASKGADKRLFMLTVSSAASDGPNAFTVQMSPNIPDINTKARVAFVNLKDPDEGVAGRAMVAIPTSGGLKTIRLSDPGLDDFGPSIDGLGATWAPSVPVQPNGNPPSSTPFLYVASQTPSGTVVSKLRQPAGTDPTQLASFEVMSQSPELSGSPGPGLAVAQEGTAPGRVIVTTSTNLFSLNTENLAAADPPQLFNADSESGFGFNIPSTSGNLGFAVTRAGQQYVFFLTPQDGEMRVSLEEDGFKQDEEALNSTGSVGQPALSRGRVVFPANNGAFVYGPSVTLLQPQANAKFTGTPASPVSVPLEAYVFDVSLGTVTFKVDGQTVATDTTVENNIASGTWQTSSSTTEGTHSVVAEATDGTIVETSAPRLFVVDNYRDPTAQLTVSPNPANVNTDVTLNAQGSAGTPGENETLTYFFEVDGDNDYNDIPGGNGLVTYRFTTPGTKTVSVRVRDSHGDVATATRTLRVNAPPTVALSATPNPAAAGQTVTIDATGTSDSDGTIAKYEFDLDGNNTFELDNGSNPKTTKAFAVTTNVSVRVTDNEGGQTVRSVTVTVAAGNQAPTASFIVAPNPAKTNQDVGFSAAASKDPDGTITKYEWDFDGNGTFETNAAANPLIARKFTRAGVFKVGLRVTDNAGATGTATVDVIVSSSCSVGSRCRPGLSASVSPKRDRALPYVFTTRGRLRLPSAVRAADGCKGRVLVQVKRGKRTISSRRVRVNRSCRFRSKVTFRDRKRLGTANRLRFSIRFQGNKLLTPRSTRVKTARIG